MQHHHDIDFMCMARTVFGHPMIGPASYEHSMYLSTDPSVIGCPSMHDSMTQLWHIADPTLHMWDEVHQ
jgi:hypothetical protein